MPVIPPPTTIAAPIILSAMGKNSGLRKEILEILEIEKFKKF
jgi:hypothetical protein